MSHNENGSDFIGRYENDQPMDALSVFLHENAQTALSIEYEKSEPAWFTGYKKMEKTKGSGYTEPYDNANDLTESLKQFSSLLSQLDLNPKRDFMAGIMPEAEVMKRLNISQRSLRKRQKAGIIPCIYLGDRIYYLKEDINMLLNENYSGTSNM